MPGSGSFPGLAGGLVGGEIAAQLALRFGGFGSFLWLCLAGVIAGVVAFDQWLFLAPVYLVRKVAPAAKVAGGATAQTLVESARGGLLSRLLAFIRAGPRG